MELERKKAIEILKKWKLRASKPTNKSLGWVEGWIHREDVEAFDMALNSLETDEAYQLEYEVSTQPSIEDFIEYAERTFGVKVSVKKSDNPDTVEKLFGECKTENLCDSCTNIGCMFQSGIQRSSCAFYIPPHLEPDNCGNYISRQSVQDTLCGLQASIDEETFKRIWNRVSNMPRFYPKSDKPSGKWIPVGERLPDKEGAYLLWGKLFEDEEYYCFIGDYDEGCELFGYWQEEFDKYTLGCLGSEFHEYESVLAWQPLPEPFKMESEDKE